MNDIFDLHSLCKHIKTLKKQGFIHNSELLPFEIAKSRFIEGDYRTLYTTGNTITHAKNNLHLAITLDMQLVYYLEKENGDVIELMGIVHLIEK